MKQFQWDEYYEKFFDWAESARMKYASALTTFGCADEVYEVVLEISCDDEKCAAQLLDRALDAGVRFTPEQVVELAGTIDEQVVSKMAASSERPFDREQLEEIDGFLDDKTFKQISKRSGIDVYADDDPDIAD